MMNSVLLDNLMDLESFFGGANHVLKRYLVSETGRRVDFGYVAMHVSHLLMKNESTKTDQTPDLA